MLQRTSRDIPALLITILIISVAWLITFRGGHDWGGDFSLYIAHARNIAEGRNYNAVNFVVVHDSPLQSPPAYPPVFPLLLAPVYATYGLDYSAMKVCVQTLWFVFIVLFYIYVRRMGLSPLLAGSVLIVLMLSYVLLDLKDSVLSESTYMVVSTATLLLTDFVYRRRLDESHPVRYGALVGMMLAITILTRITGIGLVGAFGVYELYRFRRIRLFAVVAGIVFAVFFVFYQLTLAGGGGYANHVAWKPQALVDNVVFYFKSPALLWGQLTVPFRYSLAIAFLVVSGLGYVRRFLKHAGLSEFYVGLYMIPLLLFHNGATPRYCVPVYAFLLVYAAEELRFWITTYLPGQRRIVAWAGIAVLMFAASGWNVEERRRTPEPDGPESSDFQTLVSWIKQNTGAHDGIVFNNPRVLALYTDRPSAACIDSANIASVRHYLEEVHANWIITFDDSEVDHRSSIPVVTQHPDIFRPVSRFGRFEVYRADLSPKGVATL
jgi:hypothetical protein